MEWKTYNAREDLADEELWQVPAEELTEDTTNEDDISCENDNLSTELVDGQTRKPATKDHTKQGGRLEAKLPVGIDNVVLTKGSAVVLTELCN